MTTVRHQPLTTKTCIRLLILHPGLESDTIECSTPEIDLDPDLQAAEHDEIARDGLIALTAEFPEYEALSYTGGTKGSESIILLDGNEVLIRF